MFERFPPVNDSQEWWDLMMRWSCFGPHTADAIDGHEIVADDIFDAEHDFEMRRSYTWGSMDTGYVRGFLAKGPRELELVMDFGRPWPLFVDHAATVAEFLERPIVLPTHISYSGLGDVPYLDHYPKEIDTRNYDFRSTDPAYRVGFSETERVGGAFKVCILDPSDL